MRVISSQNRHPRLPRIGDTGGVNSSAGFASTGAVAFPKQKRQFCSLPRYSTPAVRGRLMLKLTAASVGIECQAPNTRRPDE